MGCVIVFRSNSVLNYSIPPVRNLGKTTNRLAPPITTLRCTWCTYKKALKPNSWCWACSSTLPNTETTSRYSTVLYCSGYICSLNHRPNILVDDREFLVRLQCCTFHRLEPFLCCTQESACVCLYTTYGDVTKFHQYLSS